MLARLSEVLGLSVYLDNTEYINTIAILFSLESDHNHLFLEDLFYFNLSFGTMQVFGFFLTWTYGHSGTYGTCIQCMHEYS